MTQHVPGQLLPTENPQGCFHTHICIHVLKSLQHDALTACVTSLNLYQKPSLHRTLWSLSPRGRSPAQEATPGPG